MLDMASTSSANTSNDVRIEHDPLGEVEVPKSALWGAQTQRAVTNFPISSERVPLAVIHAIAEVKRAAAEINQSEGRLPRDLGDAIVAAAAEVIAGAHDDQFPIDVFQTGSGTSTHMNVNEVIANRAIERLGGTPGSKTPIHPNDHVNLGQSSNDVFPTAIHLAAATALERKLLPALELLATTIEGRAELHHHVIKIGRTHLQDALPIRLGQELGGHATMVRKSLARLERTRASLYELPLGGTAVGTGYGAAPGFAAAVIARLAERLGLPFTQAPDLREALAARDALVELSGALRGTAVSLTKIANDLRWLASGPRCGIGEVRLPELQPGSSIMPGKVNPVIPEMMLMVAADVIGADATVAWAGAAGNFELNAMQPVIAARVLGATERLANAVRTLAERCVAGLEADEERCAAFVEQSLSLATALLPRLGYDGAAAVARKSAATGKPVRQICLEDNLLAPKELDELLDFEKMTEAP
jgi:fumarate hydratase, class II